MILANVTWHPNKQFRQHINKISRTNVEIEIFIKTKPTDLFYPPNVQVYFHEYSTWMNEWMNDWVNEHEWIFEYWRNYGKLFTFHLKQKWKLHWILRRRRRGRCSFWRQNKVCSFHFQFKQIHFQFRQSISNVFLCKCINTLKEQNEEKHYCCMARPNLNSLSTF